MQGRLRPEDEIGSGDLHLASERPGPARGRGLLPRRQLIGYEPVGVRVPALAEQRAQLRLGHLQTERETEGGQTPPHPSADRNSGVPLRLLQRLAALSAAVADEDLAQEVAVHLPGRDQRDIHHGDHATRP